MWLPLYWESWWHAEEMGHFWRFRYLLCHIWVTCWLGTHLILCQFVHYCICYLSRIWLVLRCCLQLLDNSFSWCFLSFMRFEFGGRKFDMIIFTLNESSNQLSNVNGQDSLTLQVCQTCKLDFSLNKHLIWWFRVPSSF
jgi:hypothetical protein